MEAKTVYTAESVKSVTWENGVVTVTYEKNEWTPKAGDYIHSVWSGGWATSILMGGYRGEGKEIYCYVHLSDRGLAIDGTVGSAQKRTDTPATDAQIAELHATLRNDGKRWNAEKMCLEGIGLERVGAGETYYIIDCEEVMEYREDRDEVDDDNFTIGNYFHTSAEAEEFYEKEVKPIYNKRHQIK